MHVPGKRHATSSFMRCHSGFSTRPRLSRGRAAFLLTPVLVAGLVVGCQANPGDAPTVDTETTQTTTTQQRPNLRDEALREITVGVDAFDGNLNPHIVGNLGQATMAVADLTLPSAFNRVGDKWVLNQDLLVSAVPNNSDAPTSVMYRLHPNAQWSDGTPISGGDFQYLADMLRSQRTAEAAAQYRHISDIRVTGGGARIKVSFDSPQTGWRQLFHYLLPSHIYRSEGQNFSSMMNERSVASGGAYRVHAIDSGRGVIELQRNDRYWGEKPAATDRIVLTSVPDVHTGAQMLRSGQLQMYAAFPSGLADLTLGQIPGMRGAEKSRRVQLNFALNLQSQRMGDRELRAGILGSTDPDSVAQIVAGNRASTAPEWLFPDAEVSADMNRQFQADPFLIGAPIEDTQAVIAARTFADQLTRAGVPAKVRTVDARQLLEDLIPNGGVDASVTWGRTPDTPTDLANQFSCVAVAQKPGDAAEPTESTEPDAPDEETNAEDAPESAEPEQSETETPEPEPRKAPATEPGQRTFGGNTTGLCDRDVNQAIGSMTTGQVADTDGTDAAGPSEAMTSAVDAVQQQMVILPVLRDKQRFTVNKGLVGPRKSLEDWPFDPYSGVFVGEAQWKRAQVDAAQQERREEQPLRKQSTKEPQDATRP